MTEVSAGGVAISEKVIWWAQWFMLPVLPLWLFFGGGWLAGDRGWTLLFLAIFFCPLLLIALTITAVLSLMIRNIRSRATLVYAIGSIAVWVLVLLSPLVVEDAIDSVRFPPSFAERAGMSIALDRAAESGIFWGCCGLFVIIWTAIVFARVRDSRLRP